VPFRVLKFLAMQKLLLNARFLLGHLYFRYRATFDSEMTFPTYSTKIEKMIRWSNDRVRHGTIALALERIRSESIPGAIAELGVYRGYVSRFLHEQMPERKLYLFDTFDGFRDNADNRFRNTTVEIVKERLKNLDNVEFCIGPFPETTKGLEQEKFSFILFDADKYDVAMASFEFFYPRLSPGGYFFLHDFNSNESEWSVSKATRDFLQGKPESIVEIPDICGTALFRKL
jgi:O-methyltransferase